MPSVCHNTAFLTKHHKLPLITDALAVSGLNIRVCEDFDTDSLGTFTGEIPRKLSPIECVKTKAKLAAELSGLRYGLGSEGSFGGGPMPTLVNWDDELLCLFDSQQQRYIIARVAGPISLASITTQGVEKVKSHVENAPAQQGWICTSQHGIVKGLIGSAAVLDYLQHSGLQATPETLVEAVTISPDLRAHLCPERQEYIRQSARQLAERLQSHCPSCQAADFWRTNAATGLPCGSCGCPTQQVRHYIKQCHCCGYTVNEPSTLQYADPTYCPQCNP